MTTIIYTLSAPRSHTKFLEFEAVFPTEGAQEIELRLPVWRPGRYELGYFARNIQRLTASGEDGGSLRCTKTSHSSWLIACAGHSKITMAYNYYAAELNGGSTWVDDDQIYVNPVNCFLFRPDRPDAEFTIRIRDERKLNIASGLPNNGHDELTALGVQQLMDAPFIASTQLWHRQYTIEQYQFHIWVHGAHRFNETALLAAFEKFTKAQLRAFGSFPVSDYHFLFQLPDHRTRHGVEHTNSTVITLGPAELLTTQEGYLELLGISSHELYHTWNVKCIRPVEMFPYDFKTENYSRLGYVTEGVTTYYGDLFLLRSGVIDLGTYLKLFAEDLTRHMHNAGRFNLSVADSSFDTWLDGYAPGIPHRKVSIYTEGSLCAFITDVAIMKATGNRYSLDTVMRRLYEEFGLNAKGYTESDYRKIVEEVAGQPLDDIFNRLVHGTADYLPYLTAAFTELGLSLELHERNDFAGITGAQGAIEVRGYRLHSVWPGSPADIAGLAEGDLIISVNGIQADAHLNERLELENTERLMVTMIRNRREHRLELLRGSSFFQTVAIGVAPESTETFKCWSWITGD